MKENRQLVMTIEELKQDKKQLEADIIDLIREFEKKHGTDFLYDPVIRRWNGSNEAWGPIVGIQFKLVIS